MLPLMRVTRMLNIRQAAVNQLKNLSDGERETLAENLASGSDCFPFAVPPMYYEDFKYEIMRIIHDNKPDGAL